MRFSRLYSATLLVAAAAVLSSCGEAATPTATPQDPALSQGNREYSLAPGFVNFVRDIGQPVPTETKTVLIQGLIAVASYPTFGPIVYQGDGNDWLEFIHGPSEESLSRSPYGWIVGFKLKPSAAALTEGPHSATIAVNVPAALNNPQYITVSFGCSALVLDGARPDGELTPSDPRWDWEDEYNNDGNYPFDDYCLTVPAYTSVRVFVEGNDCLGLPYTHEDNILAVFELPSLDFVDYDDDGWCDNDPVVYFTNNTGAPKNYLARVSSYDEAFDGSRDFGSYRVTAQTYYDDLRSKDPVTAEKGDKPNPPKHTPIKK